MKVLGFSQCGVHASNIIFQEVEAETREFKTSESFIMSSRPAWALHNKTFQKLLKYMVIT